VVSFSYWSIKLWFHTEGKLTVVLIIPSSWGFPTGPVRHQDCFLVPLPGIEEEEAPTSTTRHQLFSGAVTGEEDDFCKGSLSLPISLLFYCFS
jgi:hypothetical protein